MTIKEKLEAIAYEDVKTPRISLNKLAEYIEASVTRRQAIIYGCKYPSNIMTTRYNIARESIKSFLVQRDLNILDEGLAQLEAADVNTDWKKNDVNNSKDVINLVKEMALPELNGLTLSIWDRGNPLLQIQGVDISINPDLFISGRVRGKDLLGIMKLSIIKTHPLSFYAQSIVALLSKEFLLNSMQDQAGNISGKICLSFDVFQQRIVACQSAELERKRAIEAACREIRVGWDSV